MNEAGEKFGNATAEMVKDALSTGETVTISLPIPKAAGCTVEELTAFLSEKLSNTVNENSLLAEDESFEEAVAALIEGCSDEPIRILIEMSEGAITDITTNTNDTMEILIVDRDVETADPEDDRYIESVLEEPGMVQAFEVEANPAKINQAWAEAWATAANADIPGFLPEEEAQGCGCFNEAEESAEPEVEEDIEVELR